MAQINFDANQVEPSNGFKAIPAGWYMVAINKSEIKQTSDKQGAYLQLDASVIDGPHKGSPVFIRLNIQNNNQTAVEIAQRELSAICHVTGQHVLQDSTQLHGIPFQVKLSVSKSEEHGDSNDTKGYKDAQGNDPKNAGQGNQNQNQNNGNWGNNQQQGNNQNQNQNQQQGNNGWGNGNQQQQQQQQQPQNTGNGNWGNQQGNQQQNQGNQQQQGNQGWGNQGNQGGNQQQQNYQQPQQDGNGGGSAPWGNN